MSQEQEESFEIRDFQGFLRKCLNIEQLELVNLAATQLLPLGENYGSVMIKLDATVRRSKGAKKETLHFVAKMSVVTDQPVVNWLDVLSREVYMYTQLIPIYERLDQKLGVESIKSIFPKYIGHRYSLDGKEGVVDEHSILLLENLKSRGYYTGDRRIGINLEHARKALTSLAKFHALGMVMKKKRPDIIENVIERGMIKDADWRKLDEGFDSIINSIRNDDSFNKHLPVIETTFAEARNGNLWMREGSEPWTTIIHGDFWTNNMMFHKDDQGRVDDIKFIDFQISGYNSPLRDLPCFLFTSLDESAKVHHMDELIDLYYETFIRSLESVGVDIKPFARADFDRELKRQALIQFPLCCLAFKFLNIEVKEEHTSGNILGDIVTDRVQDEVIMNIKNIIDKYEKKGWL